MKPSTIRTLARNGQFKTIPKRRTPFRVLVAVALCVAFGAWVLRATEPGRDVMALPKMGEELDYQK